MSVPWQICYSNHNIVNVKLKHHHTLLFCFVYHIFPIALNIEVFSYVLILCHLMGYIFLKADNSF